MAAALFRALLRKDGIKNIRVDSCGLQPNSGDPLSPLAVKALAKFGVKNVRHKAKALSRELYDKADILICMTEGHKRLIIGAENGAEITTVARIADGSDVSDPWGGSFESYIKTAEHLEYACADILKYVKERMALKPKIKVKSKK